MLIKSIENSKIIKLLYEIIKLFLLCFIKMYKKNIEF